MRYSRSLKPLLRLFPLAAVFALVTAPSFAAADPHAHDHAHAQAPASAANVSALPGVPAQPWATNAALRDGMSTIRDAVATVERAHQQQRLTAAQAQTLVDRINTAFASIAAACELPPDADAALHQVIVHLLEGAAGLTQNPRDATALAKAQQALTYYAQAFVDTEAAAPAASAPPKTASTKKCDGTCSCP